MDAEARKTEIRRLRLEEHLTYREIAKHFGVSRSRIGQICKDLEIASTSRFDALSDDVCASIRRMVIAEVVTDRIVEEIQARYAVTETSIRNEVSRALADAREKRLALAIRLYRKYRSSYRVAEIMGVTHTTAWRWLKQAGVTSRSDRHPQSMKRKVMRFLEQKKSTNWIAHKLGLSHRTVEAWRDGEWSEKSRVEIPERVARQQKLNEEGQRRRTKKASEVLAQELAKLDATEP